MGSRIWVTRTSNGRVASDRRFTGPSEAERADAATGKGESNARAVTMMRQSSCDRTTVCSLLMS